MRYLILPFLLLAAINIRHEIPLIKRETTYDGCKQQLTEQRLQLAHALKNYNKDSIYKVAGSLLQEAIATTYFEWWKNRPWDYYGKTEKPDSGSIACGYFVTTILKHCGVSLDRVALAEDYSENMIKKLVTKNHIKKFVPYDNDIFVNYIKAQGDGLYVIGLDNHTGFISCKQGEVWFVHSSVLTGRVVKEKAIDATTLTYNRYGVTGCLTKDTAFIGKWLRVCR
ncbi:MAG: hypothetical protein RIQ33_2384 [Bacteroidota bacterium]|jgi:hypothetical protein